MRTALYTLLLILLLHPADAQPPNDSWHQADTIAIGQNGYGFGSFVGTKVSMEKATVDLVEFFHPVQAELALDQKSVWYAFSLPTKRNISITLHQNDTQIQVNDVGFTVYKGPSSKYPNPNQFSSSFPSLSQMGSISAENVATGTYYVQICARNRVKDSVWISIKSSPTKPPLGDKLENPATGTSGLVMHQDSNYTLDSSAELAPFKLEGITQSAYLVFKTPVDLLSAFINIQGSNCCVVLYEAESLKRPNDWQLLDIRNWMDTQGTFQQRYNCGNTIKSGKQYVIKVLGDKKANCLITPIQLISHFQQSGSHPVHDPYKLGTLKANSYDHYNIQVSCEDTKVLPCFKSEDSTLYENLLVNKVDTGFIYKNVKMTSGYWITFYLPRPGKVSVSATLYRNSNRYAVAHSFIFKGKAKANVCELREQTERNECLAAGYYTIFICHHKSSYDRIIGRLATNAGNTVEFSIDYRTPDRAALQKPNYHDSIHKALPLNIINYRKKHAIVPIPVDHVSGKARQNIIDNDTLRGHFSFVRFTLDHAAHIRIMHQEDKEWFDEKVHLYKTNNGNYLKKYNWWGHQRHCISPLISRTTF